MFTKLTLRGVTAFFTLTEAFLSLPLKWTHVDQRLEARMSRILATVHVLYYCWVTACIANVAVSLCDAIQDSSDAMRIVIDALWIVHYVCDCLLALTLRKSMAENSFFFTSMLKYNRVFADKLGIPPSRFDGLEMIWLFAAGILVMPGFCVVFFVLKRNSKRYIYHRLPERLKTTTTYMIWILLEYYGYAVNLSNMTFYIVASFMHVSMTYFWNTRLFLKLHEKRGTMTVVKAVDVMKVLDRLAFECFSTVYVPLIILIIVSSGSIGLYGMIMLPGKVPIYGYVFFPCAASLSIVGANLGFHRAGKMYKSSCALLLSMQSMCPDEYIRKKCRAARPMRLLWVGRSFFMDPTYVLTLMQIISNLVINAILLL